ncbi:hypothetical protein BDF20DRAFT_838409 [Mycotypha africana]|uniref:uncharacterized protein n=1 Tax=Mycotypha africana TaxID=64632 RepID=UPI0023002288|nr:uncharacterized protein BDF20DRAFT_838409 [Mycotypha africana]KAI8970000.1 hypothetical protein BDF20DRAFT_838409 [Mycotypha africana]
MTNIKREGEEGTANKREVGEGRKIQEHETTSMNRWDVVPAIIDVMVQLKQTNEDEGRWRWRRRRRRRRPQQLRQQQRQRGGGRKWGRIPCRPGCFPTDSQCKKQTPYVCCIPFLIANQHLLAVLHFIEQLNIPTLIKKQDERQQCSLIPHGNSCPSSDSLLGQQYVHTIIQKNGNSVLHTVHGDSHHGEQQER